MLVTMKRPNAIYHMSHYNTKYPFLKIQLTDITISKLLKSFSISMFLKVRIQVLEILSQQLTNLVRVNCGN